MRVKKKKKTFEEEKIPLYFKFKDGDTVVYTLPMGLRHVRVLSFGGCERITDQFVHNFEAAFMPELELLNLSGTKINSWRMQDLVNTRPDVSIMFHDQFVPSERLFEKFENDSLDIV